MRLALTFAILLAAHDATAKCAMPSVGSEVLTPSGTTIAADGGVVVGAATSFDERIGGAEDAVNKGWRFSDGTKQHEPTLVTLAPGLVVYKAPAGVTGALTLVDGKTIKTKLSLTADKPAALAAPAPTSIKVHRVPERYGGFRLELHASFKAAAPAGAIAIVVLGVSKTGKVARSWSTVTAGATKLQVAGSSSRCDPGIPDEIMSKAGDKIVLAWVDQSGRLSKVSKPMVVTNGS